MSEMKRLQPARFPLRAVMCAASFVGASLLSGCVAVGYSSGGGWFIWPGGLGLLIVILVVVFLLRRR